MANQTLRRDASHFFPFFFFFLFWITIAAVLWIHDGCSCTCRGGRLYLAIGKRNEGLSQKFSLVACRCARAVLLTCLLFLSGNLVSLWQFLNVCFLRSNESNRSRRSIIWLWGIHHLRIPTAICRYSISIGNMLFISFRGAHFCVRWPCSALHNQNRLITKFWRYNFRWANESLLEFFWYYELRTQPNYWDHSCVLWRRSRSICHAYSASAM